MKNEHDAHKVMELESQIKTLRNRIHKTEGLVSSKLYDKLDELELKLLKMKG